MSTIRVVRFGSTQAAERLLPPDFIVIIYPRLDYPAWRRCREKAWTRFSKAIFLVPFERPVPIVNSGWSWPSK